MAREVEGIGLVLSNSERRVLFAAYAVCDHYGCVTIEKVSGVLKWSGESYANKLFRNLVSLGLMETMAVKNRGGRYRKMTKYRLCRNLKLVG